VERNFTADRPDCLWVADITYIPTWAGFLYLAVVVDAFSRRVVGWSMATHLRTELVLEAPNLAIWTEEGFVVENVGVPPDVEVEQWPAEVIAGHDPQLEKAIEVALAELEANPPHQFVKPPYPIRVRR